MSWICDSTELVPAGWLSSAYAGHGILGAAMRAETATGEHGPGPAYNDWQAGDDAKEFRWVPTAPGVGTLTPFENCSFTYDGPSTAFPYTLYADGFEYAPRTITLTMGAPGAAYVFNAGGIASAEAFGLSTVLRVARATVSNVGGIASAEAIGTSTVSASFSPPTVLAHAYAAAHQYIAKFGLAEATQLLADEQKLLTETTLQDAINGAWSGTPTDAEKAVAVASLQRLNRQLQVSSNFMDGYLRSRVTLPLASGDANAGTLEDCCLALARCGLADDCDNATERMSKTCDGWRAWLKDIAAGRVQLIGLSGEAPPSSGGARSGRAKSGFDWGRFGGGWGGSA